MSMTLEEAIRFHTEEAEKMKLHRKVNEIILGTETYEIKLQEHTQTAEWLKELRERRKQPEIIFCKDCKHKGTKNCVANAWTTIFGFGVKDDFYCGLAARRTNE